MIFISTTKSFSLRFESTEDIVDLWRKLKRMYDRGVYPVILISTTKGFLLRFESTDEIVGLWRKLKRIYDWGVYPVIFISTTKGFSLRFESTDEIVDLWRKLKRMYDWGVMRTKYTEGPEPQLVHSIKNSKLPSTIGSDLQRLGTELLVPRFEKSHFALVSTPSGFSIKFRSLLDLKKVWCQLDKLSRASKKMERKTGVPLLVYCFNEDALSPDEEHELLTAGESITAWDEVNQNVGHPGNGNMIPGIPTSPLGGRIVAQRTEGFQVVPGRAIETVGFDKKTSSEKT